MTREFLTCNNKVVKLTDNKIQEYLHKMIKYKQHKYISFKPICSNYRLIRQEKKNKGKG